MKAKLGKTIWMYTLTLIVFGLVALFSASFGNVRVSQKIFYDQLVFSPFVLLVMYVVSRIHYRKFYDIAYIFYIINIFVLIFVLVSGKDVLGARRWINLGVFSFQPSEITKLSLILVLGRYFHHRRPKLKFTFLSKAQVIFRDLIVPFLLTIFLMFLIFQQPDLGTALLLFGIFFVMLFISGIEYKYLLTFVSLCLFVLPFGWSVLKDYQKGRLLVFMNPNIDPLGAGYTIIQSKIAVGSGQLLGKGWLSGTQNQLNFLPERHTDFIFSVIGEEWGFVGAILVVFCFFKLIMCGVSIVSQVKDNFGKQVAIGIITILTLQVVINIGMVIGLFPIVGLTLPLISYGRSSFLVTGIMMGFLINLSEIKNNSY